METRRPYFRIDSQVILLRTIASLTIGILAFIPAYLLIPVDALAANECFCILWLRTERNINIRGDAWTITPTHLLKNASVGDVLLTTEGPGHGAEIVGFEGQMELNGVVVPRWIHSIEANYERCKVSTRRIEWTNPEIRGIYHPYPQL